MAQERRVAKNLELQDGPGESTPYMELQDTGQEVADQWQLRNDRDVANWQPIEYQRQAAPRTNWILPSLVGIMLLAVLGYVGWVGYERFGSGSTEVPALGTPTSAAEAGATDGQGEDPAGVAAVQQETATTAPEATLPPADIATPLPQPTAVLVDQQIATITNLYGVNARLEPNTTSDVLRVLEQGETAIVVDELTDAEGINWLQVQISEGALVWISAEFAEITTQQVAAEPSADAGTDTSPASTDDGSAVVTPGESEAPAAPALDVSVTISSPFGLNARALPNPDAEIITLLENAQTLPAIARSLDNTWVQVQLDNGDLAWVFLELVTPQGDLTSLPAISGEEAGSLPAVDSSQPLTSTTPATATQTISPEATVSPTIIVVPTATPTAPAATAPITETDTVTNSVAAPPVPDGATATVTGLIGASVRPVPNTSQPAVQTLPSGTTLPLVGRSADSQWVQVTLEDGTLAWAFAKNVSLNVGIDELPVTSP